MTSTTTTTTSPAAAIGDASIERLSEDGPGLGGGGGESR